MAKHRLVRFWWMAECSNNNAPRRVEQRQEHHNANLKRACLIVRYDIQNAEYGAVDLTWLWDKSSICATQHATVPCCKLFLINYHADRNFAADKIWNFHLFLEMSTCITTSSSLTFTLIELIYLYFASKMCVYNHQKTVTPKCW